MYFLNNLLYWINILIFPIIILKILENLTDVHIFTLSINDGSKFVISLVIMLYLLLIFFSHLSISVKNPFLKKHLTRYPTYIVSVQITILIIYFLSLLNPSSDGGLGAAALMLIMLISIFGVIASSIFLKKLVKFSGLSGNKKYIDKPKTVIILIAQLILIPFLFYLPSLDSSFCSDQICEAKYSYNHPDGNCIHGGMDTCVYYPAIIYSDKSFCENNYYKKAGEKVIEIKTNSENPPYLTRNGHIERCKNWVDYFHNKDFLEEEKGFEYPTFLSWTDPPGYPNINVKESGRTAIMTAKFYGHKEIVALMTRRGLKE